VLKVRSPQGRGISARLGAAHRRGFTLVELMVALLVLTVGLLGALALLMRASRGAGDALARSQSALLAQGLAEIMRSNRSALAAGAFDSLSANAPGVAPALPTSCALDTGPCTDSAMAQADLARWQHAVATTLPAGTGASACVDTHGTRLCEITLSWRERFSANDIAVPRQSVVVAVRP
jgi:type IV pilus assembly protein PilV